MANKVVCVIRFFQCFPRELNFNILKHVITHLYKHIGEENVW